jgi:hypothetical protein
MDLIAAAVAGAAVLPHLLRMTLKAGSSVFTVCVREMATAAKLMFAAMCPMACMKAGPKILPNSSLLMACRKHGETNNN